MAYAVRRHVDEDKDKENNNKGAYYVAYLKYPFGNPEEMLPLSASVSVSMEIECMMPKSCCYGSLLE